MRKLWLLLPMVLAGCGKPSSDAPVSETKDMASNYYVGSNDIFLFYVEHGTIYRAQCDPNRLIYNRSTCSTVVGSADFAEFSERLRAKFAAPMPAVEQLVADLHARIQEVDLELLLLLSTVPDPVDPTLKDQIAAKENEVNDARAALSPLEDQVARIEAALSRGENPDLRRQLITLQGQLVEQKTTVDGLQVELADLRQRYIRANAGSFEPRRFETLQSERSTRVRQLGSKRSELDEIMQKLIAVSQILADILQQGFTNVYASGGASVPSNIRIVIEYFSEVFRVADPQSYVFVASLDSNGKALRFTLPRGAQLEKFYCTLSADECRASDEQPWIEIMGPDFSTSLRSFVMEVTATSASHSVLIPMRGRDIGGNWRFTTPYCNGRIRPGQCFMQIKRSL